MSRLTILCLSVSCLLLSTLAQNNSEYCYAIALQGGGDRGAYEAGVLFGFVMNGNPADFSYDVITGVSAGSINTLGMMIYPKGTEVDMVEFLNTSWSVTSQQDIFHQWPGGYLQGLLSEPSLVNNDPELNYLRSQIYAPPIQRQAIIVTTDVNTAAKITFNEEDWKSMPENNYLFAAQCALFSSAIPAFFKYRVFPPFTFIDGGWSESIDIEDGILRCLEMGYNQSQIILDVIYCANTTIRMDPNANKFNGLEMYIRGQNIQGWRKTTFLFPFTKQSFPEVVWRYFALPTHILPNENLPVDFDKQNIEYIINLGIKDALNLLNEGPGVSMERVTQQFINYQNALSANSRTPYGN